MELGRASGRRGYALGGSQAVSSSPSGRLQGFTLIELGIALAVLGVLITMGLPMFTTWIANSKIRTGAEAVLNGVQLARAEAVRQNLQVQFVLGGASGPTEWTVSAITGGGLTTVQTRSANEGSNNAVVGITPAGATTVTFNGLGRVVSNSDGSATVSQIDVCTSAPIASADMRKMRIVVGAGGTVRMCDPQVAAGDPRACAVVVASTC